MGRDKVSGYSPECAVSIPERRFPSALLYLWHPEAW